MANEVTLTFSGDDKDLQKSLDGIDSALQDTSRKFDTANDHASKFDAGIDGVTGGLENSTSKLRSTNDLVSGLSDTMGFALPPQAGMIMGFADMADGMSGLLGPALKTAKTGFATMNATMKANPILSVIAIIVLLGTALVVAYKKSETFRKIVDGAFRAVTNGVMAMKDAFVSAFNWMKDALNGFWDLLTQFWKYSPLGLIVNSLDKVGGVIGGIKGGIGKVLGHANGGYPQGLSVVGENGPELFNAQTGRIMSNSASRQMGAGGAQTVVIEFTGTSDPIFEAFKKQIRIRGGYQKALA